MWKGWNGKSMCLNDPQLVGSTANKARDSILLHLTSNSLPGGIILGGTSLGVGDASDKLTRGNIAILLTAHRSRIKESHSRYSHCECRGGRGLMNLKEFSFTF